MYGLVLMTAMTTAPDGAEFNGFFSNLFSGGQSCSGSSSSGNCYGNYAPRYSCYGGGCTSSSASTNCNGCSGSSSASNSCNGGCNGSTSNGFGSRIRKWFESRSNSNGSCNGCTGSGGSGYGCTGSGYSYGCCGGGMAVGYSCFGSSAYSCFGGPAVAYTPIINGGLSCQGGMAWPAPAPVFDSAPAMPGMLPPATIPPPSIPYSPPEAAPSPQNTGFRPATGVGAALVANGNASRATVIVRLPVDAKLFAESKALMLTGPERKFVSPELPMGQEFTYHFRVEYDRDGETLSVTKKVAVRAGALLNIEFTDLAAKAVAVPEKLSPEKTTGGSGSVAATPTSFPSTSNPIQPIPTPPVVPTPTPALPSIVPTPAPTAPAPEQPERAQITVKLPAGATLYVDDRKSPSTEAVRKFNTPPLPAGREYAYLMRAEIVRNGQTETFTQKVPFRAGERVDVDFTGTGR